MGQRLDLHAILQNLSPNVYFQPPSGFMMEYPCIVYEINNRSVDHADNNPYRLEKSYQVTVITRDPDSTIPDQVALLPKTSFRNAFKTNNLNHEVFEIFF